MGTYLQQPTIDKLLTPLMVVVNQYKLDTVKYRRGDLKDVISETEYEFLAIRNNSLKFNPTNVIGNDPLCKITPRELNDSIQKSLTLLINTHTGGAEYKGSLDFKMTVTPRKVNIQFELSDGCVLKTTYSRNLVH